MPYVNITQALRDIIKEERKKRDISTISLSESIKKGKAYISQIESGKISSIELQTFYDIFEKIIDMPDSERNEYIQNNILDKATFKFSNKEIEKQEWFITFDMKIRQFPINDDLRSIIKEKRTNLGKSPESLVSFINENNYLENKDDYLDNQLLVKVSDDGSIEQTIRFSFPENFIKEIEDGSKKTVSYIDIQGILYNLLRLEDKNHVDSYEGSKIILRNNGFLTLSERSMVIKENFQQKVSNNEDFKYYDLEPTDLEKDHGKTLEEIFSGFKYIRDKNITYSHKQITQLLKNMKVDLGLMFSVFGFPFDKLESLNFETKKKLILEMKQLVKSYIPESHLPLESKDED